MTALETERLRLRQWRDDDVEHLERLEASPLFKRYIGPRSSGDDLLARARRYWEANGVGPWAIEQRESGRFVGRCGVAPHALWPDDLELGWGIDPELWGRGYATEAATAAMQHAFVVLRAPRLVSIIHPENAASIRVAEKLGERPYANVRWEPVGIDLIVYAREAPAT